MHQSSNLKFTDAISQKMNGLVQSVVIYLAIDTAPSMDGVDYYKSFHALAPDSRGQSLFIDLIITSLSYAAITFQPSRALVPCSLLEQQVPF
jgi:hypothetical protein